MAINKAIHFTYQVFVLSNYVIIKNAINYSKPLQSSYSGLKKCTNYQNISMCENAISKSGLTNQKVFGGNGAKNFATYTLTYLDGSKRDINISRRFTHSGSQSTMYIKNTLTGKEIKATSGCWHNYTGHKHVACYGPLTVNGRANGYICCYADNINQLLEM